MAKETNQDAVVFTDENGAELTLHIVDYFLYNGDEYVVLTDNEPCDCCDEDDDECGCGEACCCEESDEDEEWEEEDETCECCGHNHDEVDVYVMRVKVVDDENEEFVPIEPDMEEEILDYAEKFLNGDLPDEAY